MKLLLLLTFLFSFTPIFARTVNINTNIDTFNLEGSKIYAFSDTNYLGVYGTVDASGVLSLEVPEGAVKYRVNYAGETYTNLSTSSNINIDFIRPVTIYSNIDGYNLAGKRVYVFEGNSYKSVWKNFAEDGTIKIYLPNKAYRFRID